MALTFTIGGDNFLAYLDFKSIAIQQSREVKGSTLNFNLRMYDEPPARPRAGKEVILTDGSTREFGGTLIEMDRIIGESNRLVGYTCSCIDYTYYLDRRFLNKIYASAAADDMMKEVLDDLKSDADAESALGDSHYDDFQGDKTLIDLGPTIRQQRFEQVLPSQAFDIISEASGMMFWVDFNKRVNLTSLQANQSPLPKDSSGNSILDVESDVSNFWDLAFGESIQGVGTKSIVKDSLIKSTSVQTDNFTWSTDNENTFILRRRPFSQYDIVSVKLATVTQTQKLDDISRDASDDRTDSGSCFIYVGPRGSNGTSYVRFPSVDHPGGTPAIEVKYNYAFSDDHENIDTQYIQELADRTGGDGIHEFVFSQGSEIAVTSPEELDEISEIILARKAAILLRGSFSTYLKGWVPGQVFTIKWAKEGIDEQVFVTTLRKTILTPANDPNLGDNIILTEVQFSNIPRGVRM